MKEPRPLVLVDGSSYLYRAFHAMPKLTNSRGEHTGAIYGVANMLRKLLADYDPEYIAVVFDAPGKTFRDSIYDEYKANRPPMPTELSAQLAPLHAVVQAMGLTLLRIEGVEADDVIATLAGQAAASGMDTVISTGDKDLAQLVGDRITLIDTMTNTTYDRAGVIRKFGVPPERIVDYLALVGDPVDNIPGVPKVGPKTASQWLQQYGSLDAIKEHASEIGGKVGENLRASLATVELSRRLATVDRSVKLDVTAHDLRRRAPDDAQLRQLYKDLEFKSWLAALGGINRGTEAQAGTTGYDTVLELTQLDRWIERLRAAELFAIDTETTDLNVMNAELIGLSFTDRCGEGAYVPIGHTGPAMQTQLDRGLVLQKLKDLLEDHRHKKVGQNLKYDMSVLARHGIELRGIEFDTMLESYVLDSTGSRHDMDGLALKYLGYKTITYEEVAGKGKNQINFREVPIDSATRYAAEDADITLRLHQNLWPRLEQLPSLAKLFRDIEMPLVPVLSRIERHGVRIDTEMLRRQSGELAQRLAELEQEAYRLAELPFNLASPLQIQEILFVRLKLPVLKKTPKGQPSTAEEVLQELSIDYPLPRVILEYRGIAKLKSTYTDKLPEMVNPRTGRVHTSYHQAVAATGRLSSSDPNLQNIPVRTAEGRRIRKAFVPEPGNRLLSADYSQIELRIMAHLSGDPGLLAAFEQGSDVHRATAAEVFGVSPDEVSDEMRRNAKAINFGLIYGMSSFGLAQQLRIDRGAAQAYIDLYFARYPGVRDFMDRTRAQAHAAGYVETVFGRRLYLPEINTANQARRQYAERTAINAPMQGTAADLIKLAMLAVDSWILESGTQARMIMQVHDELVFEVPEAELGAVGQEVRQLMTGVARLAVPLVVDIGTGLDWDEAH
ncbi:MAG: DNA polymerase I [Gammaproteobacteria bacterium]|nr:DNA polymerase I [Gammaproteobacteria bacterium]